jgi:uncharacterized protein (DUF342 family)
MAATNCQPALNVEISSEGDTVTLKPDASHTQGVDPAELIAHLRALGVPVDDPTVIEKLAGEDGRIRTDKSIVLLEGKPPIPEQPSTLEVLVQPPDPDSCDSYYERTAYLNTKPGQAIAKINPAIPGQDGIDVFGNPIKHKRCRAPEFNFVDNVQLDADGITVRATSVGRIYRRGDRLWVNTALEVPGDVDFACCNVNVAGDVDIHGSVLDLFKVKGDNIYVGGAIEASEITAANDIHVRGGIVGKEKAHLTAGGDITAKYISGGTLEAVGDVKSHREIVNSRIICGGRLTVERGPLTSGHVTANGGVTCRTLGSRTTDKILVETGFDEAMRRLAKSKLAEAHGLKRKAAKLRGCVPAAGPSQGAQDILHEAEDAEKTADEILATVRQVYAAAKERSVAEVVVQDLLHAGVTIRFANVETTTEMSWKGPMRIVPQQSGEDWEIVMIDARNNSAHALPSRPWHDSVLGALELAFPDQVQDENPKT